MCVLLEYSFRLTSQLSFASTQANANMQPATDLTNNRAMASCETPFPLMKLPGEMRNMIYRHYFDSFDMENMPGDLHKLQTCLNILHSSRAVRSEAATIFYKEYLAKSYKKAQQPGCGFYWEIRSAYGPELLRLLKAFSSSLNTYGVDLKFGLMFSNILSHEPLSFEFHAAVWQKVEHPTQPLSVTPKNNRHFLEDAFENYPGSARLSVGQNTNDREYHMVYNAECQRPGLVEESLLLSGPLARVDWGNFHFAFPRQRTAEEVFEDHLKATWKRAQADPMNAFWFDPM